MPDNLSLDMGSETVGVSGAVNIGSGSSVAGLGGSFSISVGSGDGDGGVFSVTAGKSSAASGGNASVVAGLSSAIICGDLTLAVEDDSIRDKAVLPTGGDGASASGGSNTFSSGFGTATSTSCAVVSTCIAGVSGVSCDLSLGTGSTTVGYNGAVDIGGSSSVSGSVGRISISVGPGDGVVFSATAGESSGARDGGSALVVAGLSSTSIGGGLTLAAGYGSTSGGYVPPTDDAGSSYTCIVCGLSLAVGDCSASQESGILEGGDGASAVGGSITITSGKDLSKYQQPKKWMVTFGQDQLISNNSHKARKQNVFSMPQRRLYWWL